MFIRYDSIECFLIGCVLFMLFTILEVVGDVFELAGRSPDDVTATTTVRPGWASLTPSAPLVGAATVTRADADAEVDIFEYQIGFQLDVPLKRIPVRNSSK